MIVALLARRPLWLDEILQLGATRDGSLAGVVGWAARNPGGVPLGYLTQWASLRLLGYSTAGARATAALFAILSCILLAVLARQLGIRRPAMAVLLFALLPLEFRYALEARPYSEALFFGVLSTVAVIALSRRPWFVWWMAYALALAAGLYTQPYSFFLAAGHLSWAVAKRSFSGGILALQIIAAGWLALALFQPWLLHAGDHWSESIAAAAEPAFRFSAAAPLLVLHDFAGGYLAGLLLLAAACVALVSSAMPPSTKVLLVTCSLPPVALAFFADEWFGYFFAIRQIIWVAPALILLAAAGLEKIRARRRDAGAALSLALLAAMGAGDARFLAHSPEDWEKAARILRDDAADGSCVAVVPPKAIAIYRFFEPGLASCGDAPERAAVVTVALTPYAARDAAQPLLQRLRDGGFTSSGSRRVGGSEIRIFHKSHTVVANRGGSFLLPVVVARAECPFGYLSYSSTSSTGYGSVNEHQKHP